MQVKYLGNTVIHTISIINLPQYSVPILSPGIFTGTTSSCRVKVRFTFLSHMKETGIYPLTWLRLLLFSILCSSVDIIIIVNDGICIIWRLIKVNYLTAAIGRPKSKIQFCTANRSQMSQWNFTAVLSTGLELKREQLEQ